MKALLSLLAAITVVSAVVPATSAAAYVYRGHHYRYHYHGRYYHHRHCHGSYHCRYW